MSDYIGDFVLGATVSKRFTTVQSTGAPTTLSGSPVIKCYPSGSTTEIASGITLTVDYDSRTGFNDVSIVASSGNTYAVATDYDIVITTGTVNSVSVVGYVVGTFSIQNRAPVALTAAYDAAKTAAQAGNAMTLTAAYDSAKTAASPTDVASKLTAVGLTTDGVTIIAGVPLHLAGTGGQGIGG